MPETFQDRVRKRVAEMRIAPVTAALEAGLERTFIVDIVKEGGKKSVRAPSLPRLARALLTTVEYLTFQTDDPNPPAPPSGPSSGPLAAPPAARGPAPEPPAPNVDLSRAEDLPAGTRFGGPRNVPVYGTAVGGGDGDGDFRFNGETIDYAPRPPGIATRRDVYVLYVENDSMYPRFRPGARLYVDPNRRPNVGDDVIVELHGDDGEPGRGFIKSLVRRTPTRIVVEQFNPPKVLEFDMDRVKSLHRVIPYDELLGV